MKQYIFALNTHEIVAGVLILAAVIIVSYLAGTVNGKE